MSNVARSPVEARPRVESKEGAYKVAAATLVLVTNTRVQLKNITQEIAEIVAQSPIRDGLAQISSLHTTAFTANFGGGLKYHPTGRLAGWRCVLMRAMWWAAIKRHLRMFSA